MFDFITKDNVHRAIEYLESLIPQWEAEAEGRLPDYEWQQLRREVWQREKGRCQNCHTRRGKRDVHHIVYVSKGGTNKASNLALLCRRCHNKIHGHLKE